MPRILVIDDEPSVRQATRRILEREGHEVVEAETGEEGLEMTAGTPVDLVITDLVMPGEGGVETIARLKERQSGTRIIAMSAIAIEELPEAEQFGATRTLPKPFKAEELLSLVNEVLSDTDTRDETDLPEPEE